MAQPWVPWVAAGVQAWAASRARPKAKPPVAAFMDAYNKMVVSLRNYKAQEVKGGLAASWRSTQGLASKPSAPVT